MSQPPEQLQPDDALDAAASTADLARVGDLLGLLGKGLRAHQMYQANNPVYQRFVEGLRTAFVRFWQDASSLRLTVEESVFRMGERTFVIGEGRDNLAFLFYKDGVRHLTFLPGFEDELERFLGVVHRARHLGPEEDDLVTLLWEQEFDAFEYGYVDMLAEGIEIPDSVDATDPDRLAIPPGVAAAELEEVGLHAGPPAAPAAATTAATPSLAISREDFQETLYFLDPAELEALRGELDREWARDVRAEVLNALFDRLEDGESARQAEILSILRQLLPVYVGRGNLGAGALILRELDAIVARGNVLGDHLREEVGRLFDELSSPVVLGQLVQVLEDGGIQPNSEDLSLFLGHLRPAALPGLVRAAEVAGPGPVRERLEAATDRLALQHVEHIIELIESPDETLAIGAARLAGRLRLTQAADRVTAFLARPDPAARLTAVEALVQIRSASALAALQEVLEDPVREIRIAAVRGLGALRYQPSRARFEELLEGRIVRAADLTEKLAFFEAYAAVAGGHGVGLLDRLLNGRGLLGRRQAPEIRACAAMALGRIGVASARTALERARDEAEPVVRNAVQRALRHETTAAS